MKTKNKKKVIHTIDKFAKNYVIIDGRKYVKVYTFREIFFIRDIFSKNFRKTKN